MDTLTAQPELFGSAYYQNPYPAFAWLREHAPMHRFRYPVGDVPLWIVSRFADVQRLLADPRFSTDGAKWARQDFRDAGLVLGGGTVVERTLTMLDPPDHTRVRKLAMSSFTPRGVAKWQETIDREVADALDWLGEQAEPDLMDYAERVPARVMGAMLGFSLDRYHDVLGAIARGFDPSPPTPDAPMRAFEEVADYGRELIREKRRTPGDDLISMFIAAREGGDRLTEDELVSMVALMIIAGLDTVRSVIGSAALALFDFPDQRRLLLEQPDLVDRAVEEFVRYDGAFTIGLIRFATEDLEFMGERLTTGTPVIAALQSANRDPERFPDPDRLDITRTGPRHVGFGHGLHNCLGAALARLQTRTALPALFRRYPDLEPAVPRQDVRHDENWLGRSVKHLPVRLDGRG
ncbi:cytochrome P450 family protein [Saccharothrix sp. Mg75]|uniref:cytochrome P450 family protein n=1 Tax=Saccharothrix sp. Mg75 TaxID=3445357 RepID=UPI003EEB2B13